MVKKKATSVAFSFWLYNPLFSHCIPIFRHLLVIQIGYTLLYTFPTSFLIFRENSKKKIAQFFYYFKLNQLNKGNKIWDFQYPFKVQCLPKDCLTNRIACYRLVKPNINIIKNIRSLLWLH